MSDTRPTVAVLGTGIMGAGMARSLLREGLEVTVWNRSTEKAQPLADDGARVADDAADAVAGADVVITMLFDTDAVAQTMEPVLPRFRDGAVWVQTSTVGIEGTDRLAALARDAGVDYLDAPMLGTKAPAENGQLVVLASGPSSLQEKVQPVFDAIGTRTQWVSETIGDASRLKLAINAWIGVMVNGIAQSIALARGLGLDPQQFLDAVDGGAVNAPYVQLKGKAMIEGDYAPSFELDGVIKDTDLITAALREAGVDTTLATAVRDRLGVASSDGHGNEDMAAVVHAYRPLRA
ncbi:MAG: 3-hydroxyisobutyrate dehydrogenase [Actinomycetospora sp.]|jgi:3-hydroxyisobutyrate dehydrogenase|nr:3-hydroxyisobutyrate dehydrogenase [Actinomycetospora sp.]